MSTNTHANHPAETDEVVTAATAGDEAAFAKLVGRHRRELQVHCYRMVGSFDDAEDLVQETFLRAWRRRETFAGRSTFRAWLYRIATNACLDAIERRGRPVPQPGGGTAEVLWLQPYPDHLLEGLVDGEAGPDDAVVSKETIELAFLVAIQHVPPQPRAVLVLRDVLGWSAKETAALLDTSVAAVNSGLQRARATMQQHLPERRLEWPAGVDADTAQRRLLERYVEASERGDADALAGLLHEEVRFSMPPTPGVWEGREKVVGGWVEGGFGSADFGRMRCVLTSANRQPAVACYLQRAGEGAFRPLALDVLRIEDGTITEIVTFPGEEVFEAFGLPPTG